MTAPHHSSSSLRRKSLGIVTTLSCALLLSLACSDGAVEVPLVLSGDERLQDGALSMDERDVQASFVEQGLRVSFVVHSDLPIDLSTQASLSLRNLQDRVVSSGTATVSRKAHELKVSALLSPAPALADSAAQAAFVIHGDLRSGGLALRFRRSLFSALTHGHFVIASPTALRAGQHFPVLASFADPHNPTPETQNPRASLWWTPTDPDEAAPVQLEGQSHSSPPDMQLEAYTIDAQQGDGALSLHLQQPDDDDNTDSSAYSSAVQLAALSPPFKLRIWPDDLSLIDGQPFRALISLQQQQGGPLATQSVSVCLRAEQFSIFCQNLISDARGLVLIDWPIPAGLGGDDALSLQVQVADQQQDFPLQRREASRRRDAIRIILTQASSSANAVRLQARIPDARGLRFHLELRADSADGPLLAERAGWLRDDLLQASLPIPQGLALQVERWFVLIGVEDALGRRFARSLQVLASEQGLVMRVILPNEQSQEDDFALLISTRDSLGHPLHTSGTLHIADQDYPFDSDAQGLALLSGLRGHSDVADLVVVAHDEQGHTARWQRRVHFAQNAASAWPWQTPQQLDQDEQLLMQLDASSPGQALCAWLSDDDTLIDSSYADSPTALQPGQTKRQLYWLNSLAADEAGILQWRTQAVLAADLLHISSSEDFAALRPQLLDSDGQQRPAFFMRLPGQSSPQATPNPRQLFDFLQEQSPAHTTPYSLQDFALGEPPSAKRGLQISLADKDALQARARAAQQVNADLAAIFAELGDRVQQALIDSAEIGDWVLRRAHAYYDPWGQSYLLDLDAGQLRLQSLGLDELPDSGDELQATRFIHALVMPGGADRDSREVMDNWQHSLAANRPEWPGDDEQQTFLSTAHAGQLFAFDDAGQTLQHPLPPLAQHALIAPAQLALRQGDDLTFTLQFYAPQQHSLQLDWTQALEGLRVQAPTSLHIGRDGWARAQITLDRFGPLAPALQFNIHADNQVRVHRVVLRERDDDADLDLIDSWCNLTGSATTLHLDAQNRAQRRAPVLYAQVWDSGAALADYLATQILSTAHRPLQQNIDDLALALLARSRLPTTQQSDDSSRLILLGALQRSGGGFASAPKATRADIAASLSALQTLSVPDHAQHANVNQEDWRENLGNYFFHRLQEDGGLVTDGVSGDPYSLRRQRLRLSARLLALSDLLDFAPERVQALREFVRSQAAQVSDPLSLARAITALQKDGQTTAQSLNALREQLWSLQQRQANTDDEGDNIDRTKVGLFVPIVEDSEPQQQALLISNALALQALLPEATADEQDRLIPALKLLLQVCSPRGISASSQAQSEILRALQSWPQASGELVVRNGANTLVFNAQQDPPRRTLDMNAPVIVEAQSPQPLLSMIWLQARPILPQQQGISLRVDAPALIGLRRGQLQALPLQIQSSQAQDGDSAASLYLWTQGASCVDLALQIGDERVVFAPGAGLGLTLDAQALEQDLQLLLFARMNGHCAMPVLRLQNLQEPQQQARSGPHNIVITD